MLLSMFVRYDQRQTGAGLNFHENNAAVRYAAFILHLNDGARHFPCFCGFAILFAKTHFLSGG